MSLIITDRKIRCDSISQTDKQFTLGQLLSEKSRAIMEGCK